MRTHREYLNKQLKDPAFAEAFRCENHTLRIAYDIHSARVRLGMSQKALAIKAGVTQQMVSRVENAAEAHMTHGTVCRIAEALGMDVGLVAKEHLVPYTADPGRR
ncbi:MAG: helix-turn-helix transcriptional regulator [Candidatus Bipolaricaulis sp.]|nr:helix-turn-helix transcriptional regulator [Candidatus Bipolaricaulis sp.]